MSDIVFAVLFSSNRNRSVFYSTSHAEISQPRHSYSFHVSIPFDPSVVDYYFSWYSNFQTFAIVKCSFSSLVSYASTVLWRYRWNFHPIPNTKTYTRPATLEYYLDIFRNAFSSYGSSNKLFFLTIPSPLRRFTRTSYSSGTRFCIGKTLVTDLIRNLFPPLTRK